MELKYGMQCTGGTIPGNITRASMVQEPMPTVLHVPLQHLPFGIC